MNKYQVLDDVGLTTKKTEIEECLKLRYKNTNSKCILSVDWLYYIISTKLEIVVYKIHIIHSKHYLILTDLLNLLSHLETYLNLCTKRLLIEENKVREKLDELSTKKLRTKNTVKTSEQLSLSKDLQRVVTDDLEGLREMRDATSLTLDTIIKDRANTFDIQSSLRFFGKRIQSTFPSEICCFNNGNYQQFIYNNIQYTSELALMMADCQKFLEENSDLKSIIHKNNILQQYQTKITRKHTLKDDDCNKKDNNDDNDNDDDDDKKEEEDKTYSIMLYFDDNDDDKDKIIDLSEEFNKLNDRMGVTIRDMSKYCSTLQELFQLKTKLGKQLIKFVKYHWK